MKFVHALIVVIVAITIVVGAFAMLVPVYKKMRQAEQTVRVKREIHEQLRGEIMNTTAPPQKKSPGRNSITAAKAKSFISIPSERDADPFRK